MPKLNKLIKDIEELYNDIPILNNLILYNTKELKEIQTKIQIKLSKIEIIYKRISIYFPEQTEIRKTINIKNTEILISLQENLIKNETRKKYALLYLQNSFHYIINAKYKYHLNEYFHEEINNIYDTFSYVSFKPEFIDNLNLDYVLLDIYNNNFIEIIKMLIENRKYDFPIKNIKTVFATYGHKFSVLIYLLGVSTIFLLNLFFHYN